MLVWFCETRESPAFDGLDAEKEKPGRLLWDRDRAFQASRVGCPFKKRHYAIDF